MKKLSIFLLSLGFMFAVVPKALAYDIEVGNEPIDRTNVDTYHNFTIVDTNDQIQFDGFITQFDYWASNTNPFKFIIVNELKEVMFKTDFITPDGIGLKSYPTDPIPVNSDWNVGLYFQNTGTIPFDYNVLAEAAYYTPNNFGEPNVGDTISPAGFTERYYSFTAYGWSNDNDDDGVTNNEDFCPATDPELSSDFSSNTFGVHRWYYNGTSLVQTPNKNNNGTKPPRSIDTTYGCNCMQILDLLKEEGLGEFGGHYKFGCSTSILDDFSMYVEDGTIDGKYFIETVTVPAVKSTDTLSSFILVNGTEYLLVAKGTANAGDGIQFDARYSIRTPSSLVWTDAVSTYEYLGVDLLDLFFNNSTPWGGFNPSHEYEYMTIGNGNKATFRINDTYPANNTGNLTVDIYGVL